jgi:hypothetical protein
MYMYGTQHNVVVDDALAVRNGRSPILTRKSHNGAWWSPIMEKAAGKYYGTFENM